MKSRFLACALISYCFTQLLTNAGWAAVSSQRVPAIKDKVRASENTPSAKATDTKVALKTNKLSEKNTELDIETPASEVVAATSMLVEQPKFTDSAENEKHSPLDTTALEFFPDQDLRGEQASLAAERLIEVQVIEVQDTVNDPVPAQALEPVLPASKTSSTQDRSPIPPPPSRQVAARIEKAVVPLLSWDDVKEAALNNALDLRIIEVEQESKQAAVSEAKSEYFPKVNLSASLEYVDDLTGASPSTGVTSVGDTFILPLDVNQSVVKGSVNWTLIDFGKRRASVDMTKSEVVQKTYERSVTKKALLLEALNRYEAAYRESQTLRNRKKITELRRQLLDVQNRLFTAGVVPKLEVADAAIASYRAEEELRASERETYKTLIKLSGLTKQVYEPKVTTLLSLPDPENPPMQPKTIMASIQLEELPEYKFYAEAIKQKEKDLERIQRERWAPTISGYSSYVFFGSDPDSPVSAVGELSQSNFRVGVSARWTVFDGFKLKSQARQAELEIERLKLLRQQKLDEWQNRVETSAQTAEDTQITLAMSQQTKALLDDKGLMVDRLSQQQLIDAKTKLEHEIERLRHQLSQDLLIFEHRKAQKELELYQMDPS